MIDSLVGMPGGGKTKHAVMMTIDELRRTNRFIITNAAFKLHPWIDVKGVARRGMLDALKRKFGDTFDAEQRIIFLTHEEVLQFFQKRARWVERDGERIVEVGMLEPSADGRFKFDGKWPGAYYVIDELHEYFPAKDWSKLSKLTLGWLSQQRRCGDDAKVISQYMEQVAKPFRLLCQNCYHHINHKFRRVALFRQPDIISYRVYTSTPPAPGETPMHTGKLNYNREFIHDCYDTAAGVGVSGASTADIGQRARGLHWSWWPAFALVCAVAVIGLMRGCDRVLRSALTAGLARPEVVTNAVGIGVATGTVVRTEQVVEAKSAAVDPPKVDLGELARSRVVELAACGAIHTESGWTLRLVRGGYVSGKDGKDVGDGWILDGRFYPRRPGLLPDEKREQGVRSR